MKRKTTSEFILQARQVHGDRYDYSITEYKTAKDKLLILCPTHGKFIQSPYAHINGNGCPECSGNAKHTTETFIKKANAIHDYKYDYSRVDYKNNITDVEIICQKHGSFWKRPANHISGQGCPICVGKPRYDLNSFIEKANQIHQGKYDYSLVKYNGAHKPIKIVCPVHDEYKQTPSNHTNNKAGCPTCVGNAKHSLSSFITTAIKIHGFRYDYSSVNYRNAKTNIKIFCAIHGGFMQAPTHHLTGQGCPICGRTTSKGEIEITDFVRSLNVEAEKTRKIISPYELDIYIPDKNLAIEYCGLRWHSESFGGKSRKYHLNKLDLCEAQGIRLITIFEDEWRDKSDIVKSVLKNALGKGEKGIYARKTTIQNIDWKTAREFLNQYHLQGSGPPTKIRYGAYHENTLIGVITFSTGRAALGSNKHDTYEMVRHAVDGRNHPGLFSKLFNVFLREHKPNRVVSYADRRWFTGNSYVNLGFLRDGTSKPSYWYFLPNEYNRLHRYNLRKHRLIEMGGDPKITEWSNAQIMGYDRIWDCGTIRFVWEPHVN